MQMIPNLISKCLLVATCSISMVMAGAGSSEGVRITLDPSAVIGTNERIANLPGSGFILSANALSSQSYDNIEQALRQIPGVYYRSEDGFGIFPNISIRGVGSMRTTKVTVMEDGVLTAPAPYASPAAYYTPATGRMSAIEVLKGSSQVRFGPHTSGGVINYLSTPLPFEQTASGRLLFGENGEIRSLLRVGDSFDTSAGRVSLLLENFYRQSDGFKQIDGNAVDSGFHRNEPMVKIGWEPNTDNQQSLELKVGYTRLSFNETYLGLTTADFRANPFRRYSATEADNISTEHWRTYLRHILEISDSWQMATTTYFNYFERSWFKVQEVSAQTVTSAARPASPRSQAEALARGGAELAVLRGEGPGTIRYRDNNREYAAFGVDQLHRFEFETGDLEHDFSVGVRVHHDYEDRFQNETNFVQNASGRFASAGRFEAAPGSQANRKVEATAIAVFLNDEITNGPWTFEPGIRVERVFYKDNNRLSGRVREANLTAIAGGTGAVYRASEEWSLFGGVFRGISLPGASAGASGDITEETSLSFELGSRLQRGAFYTELVGFFTTFDDLIVPDNLGAGGSTTTENVGKAQTYGLELLVQADAGQYFGWDFSNPWRLAVTLTRATLENDVTSVGGGGEAVESLFAGGRKGAKLPYIPEYQVSFGSSIENSRSGLGFDAIYVPATYGTASNTASERRVDGTPDARFGKTDAYFLLDLNAFHHINPSAKIFIGMQNALNDKYIASRLPHGARPGAPRFAYAGIEVEF